LQEASVRSYSGQTEYVVRLSGLRRTLPIVQIQPHTWIASDAALILGDVAFLSRAAELLAKKIRPLGVDAVLTAEAKSIALAYELSRQLGRERFVVARKSIKSYMGDYASQKLKSITTRAEQELLLTKEEMRWLSGQLVCLLDDVVSTGATFAALQELVKKSGAEVACKAAIWKEGPWYTEEDLVCLGQLPVFVSDASPLAKQVRK
jgi:adenine phosphoribosyltransferase